MYFSVFPSNNNTFCELFVLLLCFEYTNTVYECQELEPSNRMFWRSRCKQLKVRFYFLKKKNAYIYGAENRSRTKFKTGCKWHIAAYERLLMTNFWKNFVFYRIMRKSCTYVFRECLERPYFKKRHSTSYISIMKF